MKKASVKLTSGPGPRDEPLIPNIVRGKDEITVGGGGHELHAWVYPPHGMFILSARQEGEYIPPEVLLLADEVHALGKQLCRWAREARRHQRMFKLRQLLSFGRK